MHSFGMMTAQELPLCAACGTPHRDAFEALRCYAASQRKRGPGRPPLPPGERREVGTIRLTPARWKKYRTLGGNWLDRQIDAAEQSSEDADLVSRDASPDG